MLRQVLHFLVSKPWVYDAWQKFSGAEENVRRVARQLTNAHGVTVLDVGAGTGNGFRSLSFLGKYVWFDMDWQKLAGFRAKAPCALAIIGDATNICLRDKSVDYSICTAISHHLTDAQLAAFFREASRISRVGLIFVDAIEENDSWLHTLLWKYDRGSYPRSAEAIRAMMMRHFNLECQENYSTLYNYILFVGYPKAAELCRDKASCR